MGMRPRRLRADVLRRGSGGRAGHGENRTHHAGIVSLGHAAYFGVGVGAYTAGLVSKWGWGEPLTGLLIAGLIAGAFGYLTSLVIARFRHLPLIMITLGIGLLLQEAANSASWLTGGFDGLQGIHTWPMPENSISICTAIPLTAMRSRCCF